MLGDAAECGEYHGGAEDGCEWGVWGVERGLGRVSAAAAVIPRLTVRGTHVRLHRGHEGIYTA